MLKKLSIVGLASAMLIFSGCSSVPKAQVAKVNNVPIALIKVSNGAGAPSYSYNETKAFRNVLEAAATTTIEKGYKYFAIVKPKEISNVSGSLRNTAKELIEVCSPNSALFLKIPGASGLHKCGTRNTTAMMEIAMYNEEQNNFTVINAQEVISYLKANDLYDANGVEIEEVTK